MVYQGRKLFDEPVLDSTGTWQTSTFFQLRSDIETILKNNPASWLGAVGSVLLIQKLGSLLGTTKALLLKAGISNEQDAEDLLLFFDFIIHYKLPPGYALDAEKENDLIEVRQSFNETELIVIDLLALHKLMQTCCDLFTDTYTASTDLLKSK